MVKIESLPQILIDNINNRQILADGYIRFFSNDQIEPVWKLISNTEIWQGGIPFAYTALGDVVVWDKGYVMLYDFGQENYNVILSGSDFLIQNFNDKIYQNDFFDMELYQKAVEKEGELQLDECYILEPIPKIGGARDIAYIGKGNFMSYLAILI